MSFNLKLTSDEYTGIRNLGPISDGLNAIEIMESADIRVSRNTKEAIKDRERPIRKPICVPIPVHAYCKMLEVALTNGNIVLLALLLSCGSKFVPGTNGRTRDRVTDPKISKLCVQLPLGFVPRSLLTVNPPRSLSPGNSIILNQHYLCASKDVTVKSYNGSDTLISTTTVTTDADGSVHIPVNVPVGYADSKIKFTFEQVIKTSVEMNTIGTNMNEIRSEDDLEILIV